MEKAREVRPDVAATVQKVYEIPADYFFGALGLPYSDGAGTSVVGADWTMAQGTKFDDRKHNVRVTVREQSLHPLPDDAEFVSLQSRVPRELVEDRDAFSEYMETVRQRLLSAKSG